MRRIPHPSINLVAHHPEPYNNIKYINNINNIIFRKVNEDEIKKAKWLKEVSDLLLRMSGRDIGRK